MVFIVCNTGIEQIEESTPIALQFTDNESITGKYIGKTKDVLFFLDSQNNVKATPLVNLKMYGTQPISKRISDLSLYHNNKFNTFVLD